MSGNPFFDTAQAQALEDALRQRDDCATRIRELLERTAEARRPCKACSTELFFVRHANGKLTPYTSDGVNHFVNCPEAARFKKPKGATTA